MKSTGIAGIDRASKEEPLYHSGLRSSSYWRGCSSLEGRAVCCDAVPTELAETMLGARESCLWRGGIPQNLLQSFPKVAPERLLKKGAVLKKSLQSHPRRFLGLAIQGRYQMLLAPGTAEPHVLQELNTAEVTLEGTEGSHSQECVTCCWPRGTTEAVTLQEPCKRSTLEPDTETSSSSSAFCWQV